MPKIFYVTFCACFLLFGVLFSFSDTKTYLGAATEGLLYNNVAKNVKILSKEFVSIMLDSTTIEDQKELNKKFGLGCANMGFPVYDSVRNKSWIVFGDCFGGATNKWEKYYRCNAMLGFDNDIPISETDTEKCRNRFDCFYSKEGIMTVSEHVARVEAGLGDGAVGYNDWDSHAIIHGHYKNIKFVNKYGDEATESSKIPTGLIELNGNIYMFYFSKATDVGKADRMNYGGCVKSTDGGETWTKVNSLSWANHSKGTNSAFYETDEDGNIVVGNTAEKIQRLLNEDINNETIPGLNIDIHEHEGYFFTQICPIDGKDGYIYLLGEGGYRTTGIKLARVRPNNFEDFYQYEYFLGFSSRGKPIWQKGVAGLKKLNNKDNTGYIMGSDSRTDPNSRCSELTCMYNEYLGKWMVSYLRSKENGKGGIMYRVADNIWGPYSDPEVLFSYSDAKKLLPKDRDGNAILTIYGGIINEHWVDNGGKTIYTLIAQWKKAKDDTDYIVYRSSIVKIDFA